MSTENKEKGRINWKLHLIYISGILLAIIVFQFGFRKDLNNTIISNIATVASIILSILAIIITVVSSFSTNNFMHVIRDIASNIKSTPKDINDAVDKLNSSTNKLDKIDKLDKLDLITQSLSDIEVKFSDNFNRIYNENIGIRNDFKEFYIKINSPEDKITRDNGNTVDYFLSSTSYAGLELIYTLIKFKNAKKRFDLLKFAEINQKHRKEDASMWVEIDYYWGYFLCLKSIKDFFIINDIRNQINSFKIDYINKEIEEKIVNYLNPEHRYYNPYFDKLIEDMLEIAADI